jgi:molecular chaperone DnaJ
MSKSFYDILGVDKNATQDEIKKAYKKAAVKWHPDRFAKKSEKEQKEAEEHFKEINQANDVLSDPDKRQRYDQYGDNWDKVNQGWGASADFDMGDIFSSFFGGNRERRHRRTNRGPEPGATIKCNIQVTIEDIFNGDTRTLEVKVDKRCPDCHGSGGETETCTYCHGTGMITQTQRTPFGVIQNSSPCPHCQGTGKTFKKRCTKCNATGFVQKTETIKVNIRPGVANGEQIRFTGLGFESKDPQGQNGDLIVVVSYAIDTNRYLIQGNNVFEKLNVSYFDCIVGKTLKHKLPNGKEVDVTIKPYSKDGDKITLYGKSINGGNYIFIISCTLPNNVSEKEMGLLKEIQKLH